MSRSRVFFLCTYSIVVSTLADVSSLRDIPEAEEFPDIPELKRSRPEHEFKMRNRFEKDVDPMIAHRRHSEEMRRREMDAFPMFPEDFHERGHEDGIDEMNHGRRDEMKSLHDRRLELTRQREELKKKHREANGMNSAHYDEEKRKLKEAMRELHDELKAKDYKFEERIHEHELPHRRDRRHSRNHHDHPREIPGRRKHEPEDVSAEEHIRDVRMNVSLKRIERIWTMAQEASFTSEELTAIRAELDEFIEMEKKFSRDPVLTMEELKPGMPDKETREQMREMRRRVKELNKKVRERAEL